MVDDSRRSFLRAVALLVADLMLKQRMSGLLGSGARRTDRKVIVLISGGVRYNETFSAEGLIHIPNLSGPLAREAVLYPHIRNLGVTSHFNTTSSILTGEWQRVDDWGAVPPVSPTIFEILRKNRGLAQSDVWMVSSNKALTSHVGASSTSEYGPNYGANVIFPKKLLISAVETALLQGNSRSLADRASAQAEIEDVLNGTDYEGLGWNVFDAAAQLDPRVHSMIVQAVSELVHHSTAITGDELTHLISVEIMRKFAPSLLVVSFSDVEAAHFGSYSLHLAGIHNLDRLAAELWHEVQANDQYRGQTTMLIVPEFGRDPDGSRTNGFFNHRSNTESCRDTWMMCLGAGVDSPGRIDRLVHHVDICPTIAALLGCKPLNLTGKQLPDLRI